MTSIPRTTPREHPAAHLDGWLDGYARAEATYRKVLDHLASEQGAVRRALDTAPAPALSVVAA